MIRISLAFCLFLMGITAITPFAAADTVPDEYRITDEVLVRNPPRFSMNVEFGGYAPWSSDRLLNVWNLMASCEPLQFQHCGVADGGGEDYLEHSSAPRLSYWDCARSGFWDGADMYIYRVVDGAMNLVRKVKISRSVIGHDEKDKQTEERVYFTEKGTPVQIGDLYVLRMVRNSLPEQMRRNLLPSQGAPYDGIVTRQGDTNWSIDQSTFAPEGGSSASMKIDFKGGTGERPAGLWHWYMDANPVWVKFNTGKQYRLQIWLKQQGVAGGKVRLQVGTITSTELEVGGEWKKYELDLPVDKPEKPYAAQQNDSTRILIGAAGEGTIWIDNFLIYQTDVPQFSVMPDYVKRIKEWRPQTLRLWTGYEAPSLDAWVLGGFRQPSRGGIGGTSGPTYATLDVILKLCRDVGADPWLVLNPLFTDEELAGVIEYLGGPADKGYGKLRAESGQKDPWTSVFHVIRLECANEAWNQTFCPRAWPGNPILYSRIADRMFSKIRKSPYFRREQFELIANGWDSSLGAGGWTQRVAKESKEADRIDIAMYFGGWEKGTGGENSGDDEVYQSRLFGTPIEYGPKLIDTLLLDQGLFSRMGAALEKDASLAVEMLANYKPRYKTAEPPAAGKAPDDRLNAILAGDDGRKASALKSMRGFRENVEKPAWDIARRVLGTNPDFQPEAMKLLGVDAKAAEILAQIASNLGGAPGTVTDLVKKRPELVEGMRAAIPFTADEVKTLEGIASGGKADYGVVNRIAKRVGDCVAEHVLRKDAAFIRAMADAVTEDNVRNGANLFAYIAGSTQSEICEPYSAGILLAMRDDPEFARAACAAFATRPDLFRTTAGKLAEFTGAGIEQAFSEPFEVTPWGAKILMFKQLPPELVEKISKMALKVVEGPSSSFHPTTQMLVRASYRLANGDPAPARALSSTPVLAKELEEQMRSNIMSPFLTAAGNDARIGDRVLRLLQRIPKTRETKGLCVYEAGPGYSLPGPGKPLPEGDENIGKSLVSGTATLDSFMQALAFGVAPVSYYNFKTGAYWASHKSPLDPIPYPTWLALQMRNLYADGSLMVVDPVAVATVDIPDKKVLATTNDGKGSEKLVRGRKGVAWTVCHAFKNEKQYSFLLINRDLKNPRQIKLVLPYEPEAKAVFHMLTNPDPKSNNRKEYNVKLTELETGDFKNGAVITVPPASVYLIVNNAR